MPDPIVQDLAAIWSRDQLETHRKMLVEALMAPEDITTQRMADWEIGSRPKTDSEKRQRLDWIRQALDLIDNPDAVETAETMSHSLDFSTRRVP